MRTGALLVAAAVVATLCGCGDDPTSAPPAAGTPTSGPANVLPIGKSGLALEPGRDYRSPEGFTPRLTFEVPGDGWNSTHRGADAFDVGQPVPGGDAALVVVVFMTPPEATALEALQTVTLQARAAGSQVAGDTTLSVQGGDGPLVASRDAGIELDAVPGGSARVEAVDVDGGPLLTVIWVPDDANADRAYGLAGQLVARVAQG